MRARFILLFDAEWINRNLFDGALPAHAELFRTLRAVLERPTGRCARAHAAGAIRKRRASRRTRPVSYRFPSNDGSGDNRANMQAAIKLLDRGRLSLESNTLVKDGSPLSFEFLAQTRQQERLMLSYARTLERLGIAVRIRQVDTLAILGAPQNFRL